MKFNCKLNGWKGVEGGWGSVGGEQKKLNSCIYASFFFYFTTGKFPGDKSSGNDKLHCTENSSHLSTSSLLQPCFLLTACLAPTEIHNTDSQAWRLPVCVHACVCKGVHACPSCWLTPVIRCTYLGRRKTEGLKPLNILQTLGPWWCHENQLCLFLPASNSHHHHDQTEKWDNGSGVKRHWVPSCVSVNPSQVFESSSALESEGVRWIWREKPLIYVAGMEEMCLSTVLQCHVRMFLWGSQPLYVFRTRREAERTRLCMPVHCMQTVWFTKERRAQSLIYKTQNSVVSHGLDSFRSALMKSAVA